MGAVQQRLLSEEEAATYLGTTARHLEELRYRRELPFVKVGRLVRFDIKVLDKFIVANTIGRAS